MPILINNFTITHYGISMLCDAIDRNLKFVNGMDYVVFSKTRPMFKQKITDKMDDYFNGFYAIMVKGYDAVIFNPRLRKSIRFRSGLCLEIPIQSMIWMVSLTPNPASYVSQHRLLHIGHYEDYTSIIRKMKKTFKVFGFSCELYNMLKLQFQVYNSDMVYDYQNNNY